MDFFLFQQINGLAGKYFWLDRVAVFFADQIGYFLIAAIFFIFLKNIKKYFPMTAGGIFAAILARFVLVEIIRFLFERPRPFVENNVNMLISHSASASFPSGHAAFYFALSTVVYFYNKKAGVFFFTVSFLMGLSRVFVGVHWPSDILAGAVVGVLVGWLVVNFLQRFYNKI